MLLSPTDLDGTYVEATGISGHTVPTGVPLRCRARDRGLRPPPSAAWLRNPQTESGAPSRRPRQRGGKHRFRRGRHLAPKMLFTESPAESHGRKTDGVSDASSETHLECGLTLPRESVSRKSKRHPTRCVSSWLCGRSSALRSQKFVLGLSLSFSDPGESVTNLSALNRFHSHRSASFQRTADFPVTETSPLPKRLQ